jgi:hypothetical protein
MVHVKPIHEIIEEISPYYKKKGKADSMNTLVYDSTSETLEPIYFWILDLMNDQGLAPEKLIDNFTSTPGSGHFSELGTRATRMQDEAMKIFGTLNTVLRSVLNLIYDLKEFRTRLSHYKKLKSKKKDDRDAARLSLKQVWMDKVDIAKGNSSIKAMALGQAGFQTLIDAFLVAKDEDDVKKLDLNDRVKRILKPRVQEFNFWLKQSEAELSKRYQLEKTYLKSQVNSLKLYSRWLKPYLQIAMQLEMESPGRNPNLVNTFNTIVLGLTLLGKSEIDPKEAAVHGNLPIEFKEMKVKRKYYQCALVDFTFRGLPQRVNQQSHYVFGGRVEVTFRSYGLNEDELKKLNEELDKSDIGDVLSIIEGASESSMDELKEEIDFFLDDKDIGISGEEKKSDESNPFMALIGGYNKSSGGDQKKSGKSTGDKSKMIIVRPDSWIEKTHLRSYAAKMAADSSFNLFDLYKKAHGMATYT